MAIMISSHFLDSRQPCTLKNIPICVHHLESQFFFNRRDRIRRSLQIMLFVNQEKMSKHSLGIILQLLSEPSDKRVTSIRW